MMLEKPKPVRMLTRMMSAVEAPELDVEAVKNLLRPANEDGSAERDEDRDPDTDHGGDAA